MAPVFDDAFVAFVDDVVFRRFTVFQCNGFTGFAQACQRETHIGFTVLLNDVQFHERCTHPVGQTAGNKNVYGRCPDKVMLDDDFRSEKSESDREIRQLPQ